MNAFDELLRWCILCMHCNAMKKKLFSFWLKFEQTPRGQFLVEIHLQKELLHFTLYYVISSKWAKNQPVFGIGLAEKQDSLYYLDVFNLRINHNCAFSHEFFLYYLIWSQSILIFQITNRETPFFLLYHRFLTHTFTWMDKLSFFRLLSISKPLF